MGPTLQCIAESYGEIGLRMFTKDRSFINGDITIDNTKIFGKSEKIADKIQYQFSESLKDVDNDVHPLQYAELTKTFSSSNSFKNKDVKKYDRKLKEIINGLQSGFESEMTVDLQTLTSYETELTRVIDKMNIINEEFDGFIQSDETVIYDLTATTEVYPSTSYTDTLDELQGDLKIISDKLNELYDITETKVYTVNGNGFEILSPETSNTVYQKDLSMTIMVSEFINAPSKRYYLIFYRYILNDSVTLINELTNFVNENNFTNSEKWVTAITNNINNGLKDFQKAQSEISKLFEAYENKVESTSEFKDIPYTKDKVREFTFTNNPTPPSSDTEQIQKLYSGNNEGDATKWNNKVKLQ